MPQKSSITKLDPRIRAELDRLIREGNYTIDSLVDALRSMGVDQKRSNVGRYAKNVEAQMARYREAQEVAKVWIGKLKEDPAGDVGRLLTEMLRTLAFDQVDRLAGSGDANSMDVMLLAKAIKDIAGTEKLTIERIQKIKEITRAEAAAAVKTVAKREGVSPETMEKITAAIAGG